MSALVIGLIIFLGAHSLRLFADGWRSTTIARIGERRWKALHAIVSLAGFGLILWGFGQARAESVLLWLPPVWTRHAAALLTLPAFILLVAAHVPKNSLRDAVGHPLVASVALWAAAHLLANGRGVDVLLFGGFLVWAIADYVSLRRRDRAAGLVRRSGTLRNGLLAAVAGIIAWAALAFFAHRWLFGVAPFA